MNLGRIVGVLAGLPRSGRRRHREPLLRLVDAGRAHGRRLDRDGRRRGVRVRRRRVDDRACRWAASTSCPTPAWSSATPRSTSRWARRPRTSPALRRRARATRRRSRVESQRKAAEAQAGGRLAEEIVADRRTSTEDGCLRPGRPARGRWPRSSRRSPPTAPSRPAPRRRSPTAPPPCSSPPSGSPARTASSRWRRCGRSPSRAATRRSWASARWPPRRKALERAGIAVDDVDVMELNEAFASPVAGLRRASSASTRRRRQRRRRRDRARPPARRDRRAHHRQGGRSCCAARAAATRSRPSASAAARASPPCSRRWSDRDRAGGGDRRRHDGRGHRRPPRQRRARRWCCSTSCRTARGRRSSGCASAAAGAHVRPPRAGASRTGERWTSDLGLRRRRRLDRRGRHRGRRRQAALYARLDAGAEPGSIVSSNTSTIPLAELARGRRAASPTTRITHFFNPPRYLRLLEVGPGRRRAPRRPTRSRPSPTSASARPSCAATTRRASSPTGSALSGSTTAIAEAIARGLDVEDADAAIARPSASPRTGVFGLLDLVGIDLHAHVTRSLDRLLPPSDPLHDVDRRMRPAASGWWRAAAPAARAPAASTGPRRRTRLALDLATVEYRPAGAATARRRRTPRALVDERGRYGDYAATVLARRRSPTPSDRAGGGRPIPAPSTWRWRPATPGRAGPFAMIGEPARPAPAGPARSACAT